MNKHVYYLYLHLNTVLSNLGTVIITLLGKNENNGNGTGILHCIECSDIKNPYIIDCFSL